MLKTSPRCKYCRFCTTGTTHTHTLSQSLFSWPIFLLLLHVRPTYWMPLLTTINSVKALRMVYEIMHRESLWSLSNIDRFSEFLHWHTHQGICNKVVIEDPTTSRTRRCTTFWNTNVRKLGKVISKCKLSHQLLAQKWSSRCISNTPSHCCSCHK